MNRKNFYIFIIINAIIWVCIESLRLVTSADSMEAIVWGDLSDFGTHKHPPLSGWLAGGFYHLFGDSNIGIYILGNLCVIIGLIYVYKIAKFFLNEKEAMCSSLIMTPCFYYTFQLFYDNFNCNILLMALWPMVIYYFYKSVKFNKIKDWLLFGAFSGFSFLAKYQIVILFAFMFLYLLICEIKVLKQKRTYASILLGFLIILPHIIWLYNNDFFSLLYFVKRTESTVLENDKFAFLKRFTFSIKYYLDQLLALAPTFALYGILAFKEKNIQINKFSKENMNDKLFLLLVGLMPLLAMGTMGIFTASRVVGAWGVAMVCCIGVLLFYFFPIKFQEQTYKFFLKWIYGFMICWQIAMLIFLFLQTKRDFSYPYDKVMNDFNKIWYEQTNNAPLKYVACDYAISSHIYNKEKPTAILYTYDYKNPWVDSKDLINKGTLILCSDEEMAVNTVTEFMQNYGFKERPQVYEYSYEISNKINKSKTYHTYYAIIKPQNK